MDSKADFTSSDYLLTKNYEIENEIKEFGTKAEGVTYLIMTELYSS